MNLKKTYKAEFTVLYIVFVPAPSGAVYVSSRWLAVRNSKNGTSENVKFFCHWVWEILGTLNVTKVTI